MGKGAGGSRGTSGERPPPARALGRRGARPGPGPVRGGRWQLPRGGRDRRKVWSCPMAWLQPGPAAGLMPALFVAGKSCLEGRREKVWPKWELVLRGEL